MIFFLYIVLSFGFNSFRELVSFDKTYSCPLSNKIVISALQSMEMLLLRLLKRKSMKKTYLMVPGSNIS